MSDEVPFQPPFERLAVLGLGLLGGSVAAAAKRRGLAREIVGAARRKAPLERALAAGIVDRVASPRDAVIGADFVVLGTPVGTMPRVIADVVAYNVTNRRYTEWGGLSTFSPRIGYFPSPDRHYLAGLQIEYRL